MDIYNFVDSLDLKPNKKAKLLSFIAIEQARYNLIGYSDCIRNRDNVNEVVDNLGLDYEEWEIIRQDPLIIDEIKMEVESYFLK